MRSEIKSEVKAGFHAMESRFNQIDSKFELLRSEFARVGVLMEEQDARNKFALEGLTLALQRQERVETRVLDSSSK